MESSKDLSGFWKKWKNQKNEKNQTEKITDKSTLILYKSFYLLLLTRKYFPP